MNKGFVYISRTQSNRELDKPVTISLRSHDKPKRLVVITLSLEDFAAAILGRSDLPCDYEITQEPRS